MTRLVSLLLIVGTLHCSTAVCQVVRVTNENARLTQRCFNGVCTQSRMTDHGTGVVVCREAGRSYVLTAAHVVREPSRDLRVHQQPAKIVAADQRLDVALLEVSHEFSRCADIGCADNGSSVTLFGYGGTDALGHGNGTLLDANRVNIVARDGDSGGAVVSNGQLVGLISAVGSDYTRCVSGTTLQSFVSLHLPGCSYGSHGRPAPRPEPGTVAILMPTAPTPPRELLPSVRDIPDVEKVRRIVALEAEVAGLKLKIASISSGDRGTPGRDGSHGKDGINGRNGVDGTNGKDAVLKPLVVRLDHVGPDGTITKGSSETYAPGETVVIRYRETRGQ